MSEKVQHANTHILWHKDHEHPHSSRSVQGSVQGGNGGKVYARADGKHTLDALLGPMLVLVRVAVPWISSPAPCKAKKTERVTFQRGDALKFRECSKCKLLLQSAHTQGSTPSFQWGNGGHVTEGSKCEHSPTGTQKSRARAQQSVSSRASSRGRWMKVQGMFKVQTLTPFCAHARHHSINSVGRWMNVQGKFKM